jgi:S-adenosylmethionine hydrolase
MKYFTLAEVDKKIYITTNTNSIMVYDTETDQYISESFPRFLYNTVATNNNRLYFPREQDITCYNPVTKNISFLDITPAAKHEANVVINNKLYLPCICDYDYDADGTSNKIALMKIVDLSNPDAPFLKPFSSGSVLIDDRDDSLTNSIDGDLIGPTETIKSCIYYAGKIYIPISNRGFDNDTSFNSNLLEYDVLTESISKIYSIPKDDYGQCCTLNNWLYLTAPGKVIKYNLLTNECQAAFNVLDVPLSIMSDRACIYVVTRKRIIKHDTRTNQMSEVATINLEQFIRDGNIVARDKFGVIKLVEIRSEYDLRIKEVNNIHYSFDNKSITITDDWGDLLFDISEIYGVELKKKCDEIEAISQIIPPPDLSDQVADGNIVIKDEFGNLIINEKYDFVDNIWGKEEEVLPGTIIVSSVEYGVNTIQDILGNIEFASGDGLLVDKLGVIRELEAENQVPVIPEPIEPDASGNIVIKDEFGNVVINEEYRTDNIWGNDQIDVSFGQKIISSIVFDSDTIIDLLGEIKIEKAATNIVFDSNGNIKELEAESQIPLPPELTIPEVVGNITIRDEFGNVVVNEEYDSVDTIWGKDKVDIWFGNRIISEVIIGPDIIIDSLSEINTEFINNANISFNPDGTIKEIEAESQIPLPPELVIPGSDDEEPEIDKGTIWDKDKLPIPYSKRIISEVIIGPDIIIDSLGRVDISKTLLSISYNINNIPIELEAKPLRYNRNSGYNTGDEVII